MQGKLLTTDQGLRDKYTFFSLFTHSSCFDLCALDWVIVNFQSDWTAICVEILTLNHTSSHSGMHILCWTYTARVCTVGINVHEKMLLNSFRPCQIIVKCIFDKRKHGSGVVVRYFSESKARFSLYVNQSVMESMMVQTQMILTPNRHMTNNRSDII